MIQFEQWEIGPFTFTACERWGHEVEVDPADPWAKRDHVELQVAWNDWPHTVERYDPDVSLNTLKRQSAKWLDHHFSNWTAEASDMLAALK